VSEPVSRFPRRFNAHPLQESDGVFLFLLLLLCALLIPIVMQLRNLPPVQVGREERERYLRVIYRAPEVTLPVPVPVEPLPAEAVEEVEVAEPEPVTPPVMRETIRQREMRRQLEAVTRAQRLQEQRERIRTTSLFTAAGAFRPGYGIDFGQQALGISGGSLEGLEARSREQIAVRPDPAEIGELLAEGLIRDEIAPPASDYTVVADPVLLAEAEVRLDALPMLRGRASPDSARRMDVLRKAIDLQLDNLRPCYQVQRRRDPGLQGQLFARITVAAAGDVVRVRFRDTRWSNPALGRRVEACLEQRLLIWSFDPAEGGDVTLEFPLIFTAEGGR